ncbi:hypothetical protein J2Z31_002087 [Sinorhizobium kostiense]|uniref:Uncharacterized protein n=1 Tax=Sinorhizobium kostiense TaxID=76747 RepID=A0ABS4QY75_9HYPH|nr:hypothetical protein [Sinorhizobium kostiense]
MDMMAMALLFDMASRNRRPGDAFNVRSPARETTFAERLFPALLRGRKQLEIDRDCTRGEMP